MNVSSRPAHAVRHVLWPTGLLLVAVSVTMVGRNQYTTYGGIGSWARWSEAAAAVALIGAGSVIARVHRRVGLLTSATGLLWLVPEWAGWTAGPDWVRAVGLAANGVLLAVAISTVASAWGLAGSVATVLTRTIVGGAAILGMARVVLLDPFNDPHCWRHCRPSSLVIGGNDPLGRLAERVGVAALVLAAVGVLGRMAWRLWRDRSLKASWWATLGSVALLAGLAVPAALQLFIREVPDSDAFVWPFVATTGGAIAVSIGLCVDRWRERRLGSALFQLVEDVRAAPPETIERALARTIGDPSLRLLYWSEAKGGYVDIDGRPTVLPSVPGTVITSVVRRGQPVAALAHRTAIDSGRIERAIGPAVRLSLENEQLRAATLAELAELKASRLRIVERADAERRRLERNLHDGAQQRIVGIALLLRTIRTRLSKTAGAPADALVARAEELIAATLDDLRRLAVGIHPAVLADGGLQAAVPDLAESSTDLAVRIDALPATRHPSGVESAAYLVVAEAVADARRRAATTLSVSVGDTGGRLVVELVDDAPLGIDGHSASELDDRVGSLDGRLTIGSAGDAGTRVLLELPCAS